MIEKFADRSIYQCCPRNKQNIEMVDTPVAFFRGQNLYSPKFFADVVFVHIHGAHMKIGTESFQHARLVTDKEDACLRIFPIQHLETFGAALNRAVVAAMHRFLHQPQRTHHRIQ